MTRQALDSNSDDRVDFWSAGTKLFNDANWTSDLHVKHSAIDDLNLDPNKTIGYFDADTVSSLLFTHNTAHIS